jgi:RNA polymerase-binding transcription factor DksA
MADIGTDNYEQEFTLGLIQNEEATLHDIDEALAKIDEGTYGNCEGCEKKIPKARLKVVPHARLCVECQRKEELRSKKG